MFPASSLSYGLEIENRTKFFMIGVESFRIPQNKSSLDKTCSSFSAIVYEPVLPHFDWIESELTKWGDLMCLNSEFRFKKKEVYIFEGIIAVATCLLIVFLLVRYHQNSVKTAELAESAGRTESINKENPKSFDSFDKINVPKMLRQSSFSQSTD